MRGLVGFITQHLHRFLALCFPDSQTFPKPSWSMRMAMMTTGIELQPNRRFSSWLTSYWFLFPFIGTAGKGLKGNYLARTREICESFLYWFYTYKQREIECRKTFWQIIAKFFATSASCRLFGSKLRLMDLCESM